MVKVRLQWREPNVINNTDLNSLHTHNTVLQPLTESLDENIQFRIFQKVVCWDFYKVGNSLLKYLLKTMDDASPLPLVQR